MAAAYHERRLHKISPGYEEDAPLSTSVPSDYYSALGVQTNASQAEITKAYRSLAARYHPDKHRDNALEDLAEEKLARINEAYAVLSNPKRRAEYDATRLGGGSDLRRGPSATPGGQARNDLVGFVRSIALFAVIVAAALLSLRFIRSPRAMTLVGIVILIAWFGPRLVRFVLRRKR